MCHVACGKLDCYYEDGYGGPWDVAAGLVIVREVRVAHVLQWCRPVVSELYAVVCETRGMRSAGSKAICKRAA